MNMTRRTLEILALCLSLLIASLAFHAWLAFHDDQLRLQSTLASQKLVLDAADARERDRSAALKDSLAQIESLKRQVQTPQQILRELPKYLQLPQPITISQVPPANEDAESSPPTTNAPATAATATATQRSPSTVQQGTAVTPQQGTASPLKKFLNELHLLPGSSENTSARPVVSSIPSGAAHPSSAASVPADANASSPATGTQGSIATPPPGQQSTRDAKAPLSADSILQSAIDSSSTSSSPATPAAEIPAADLKPLYDFVQDCRACQLRLAAAKQDASDNALKITALTRERDAAVTAAKGGSFWLRLRRNAHWLAIGAAASAGILCGTGHCR
jgi:hypothetical protein